MVITELLSTESSLMLIRFWFKSYLTLAFSLELDILDFIQKVRLNIISTIAKHSASRQKEIESIFSPQQSHLFACQHAIKVRFSHVNHHGI